MNFSIFPNMSNILGLWALAIIPIIIALHIFRRRYRPKNMNALFLFGSELNDQSSGRTRERLHITRSLLAEIIAALALTWFLCDPFWSRYQEAQHVIVILDSHLRLQAIDGAVHADGADGETHAQRTQRTQRNIADQLRSEFKQICDGLNNYDRMTLIASGRIPQLLTASAVPISDARTAINSWHPRLPQHSYHPSWRMAADLSSASSQAQVIFLSDHQEKDIPRDWQQISVGRPLSNSGLVDARWFHDQRGQRISIRIFRSNDTSARRLQLFTDSTQAGNPSQQILAQQNIPQSNGYHSFIFPLPTISSDRLIIRISGDDALSLDNTCGLSRAYPRTVHISIDPEISQVDSIRRGFLATEEVHLSENTSTAHLRIGTDSTNVPTSCWQMLFHAGSGDNVIGPFLTRSGHPLLQDIDCNGLLWAKAQPLSSALSPSNLQTASIAHNLLIAGSQVLISEEDILNRKSIYMHIDLTASSLMQHPAWPSLCANMVRWRQSFLPGLAHHNIMLQQENRLIIPSYADGVRMIAPDGSESILSAQTQNHNGLRIPGQYQAGHYQLQLLKNNTLITSADGDQSGNTNWRSFEVHGLNPTSSDFSNCTREDSQQSQRQQSGSHSDLHTGSVQRIRTRSEHMIPLLVAIAAALAAWFFYTREQGRNTRSPAPVKGSADD